MGQPDNSFVAKRPDPRGLFQVAEAGGAKDSILMFCDTFSTEKTAAFQADGHGLAMLVIEAALMGEVLHYLPLKGVVTPEELAGMPVYNLCSCLNFLSKISPEMPRANEAQMEKIYSPISHG